MTIEQANRTSTTAARVRLGRTELEVSPICFGTWQLSPRFWGPQPEQEIVAAIRRGFEIGINFYDTADAYGDGLAEQVLGRAIKGIARDQVVIATKVFHHFFPDGRRFADLTGPYIRQACEASLKRLDMDYIDLYQCHSWDALAHPAEIADAMDTLVKQGKVRAYGTSNWSADQLRLGERFGKFASCQPPYSLIRRDIETDVLPHCLANDIGVLVYSPLHKGLLAGRYKGQETFDDFRAKDRDFQGERFRTVCERVAQVGEIGRDYGLSIVQTVLAVTLMNPAITCAIAGIKTAAHIEEAAGAIGKKLSHEDAFRVRTLLTVPKG
jgi:aryl-alcohol dehydrogenase-like predicted oxidoreductase